MAKKYLLFTTPSCPNCPAAKEVLEKSGLEGDIVDASQPEGLDKAREFEIMEVPTAVFLDEDNKVIAKAHGADAIEEELKE